MPDVATERWSERKIDNKSAVRSFDVPASLVAGIPGAACTLVAAQFNCFINSQHPWNPYLRVDESGPQADNSAGFAVIRVTVNYALGNFTDPTPPGPLKIKWDFGSESVETDVDVEGNPIVNTAGDTFGRLFSHEDAVIQLDVFKDILPAQYNASQAVAYTDAYNTDSIGLFGYGTVEPGQVRCVSICPTDEYAPALANTYITEVFRFEIKRGTRKDSDAVWDAWKYRIVSVGNNGWATNPATSAVELGRFSKDGNTKTNVLLDGNGIPIDSTIKVEFRSGSTPATPVANPRPITPKYLETTGAAFAPNAVFLKYKKRVGQAFMALGIF